MASMLGPGRKSLKDDTPKLETPGPHSTNLSSHKGINPSRGPRARRKHTFGRAKKHVSAANGVPGPKYNRKGTFGREAAPGDLKYPPKWDRPDVRNYLGPRLACGAGSKAVRARAAFGSTVPRSKRHVVSEADFNAPGKGISQFHVGSISQRTKKRASQGSTTWSKQQRQGLSEFMNKGGADAQHGAQLADPNLPGPGQYNVKAAPVSTFAASMSSTKRFKDTMADVPAHIRKQITAQHQKEEAQRARQREEDAMTQPRPSSAPAWRRRKVHTPRDRFAFNRSGISDGRARGTNVRAKKTSKHPLMQQARQLEDYLKAQARKAEIKGLRSAAAHEEAERSLIEDAKRSVGMGGIDVGGPAGADPPMSMWDSAPHPVPPQAATTVLRHSKSASAGRRRRSAQHMGVPSTLARSRRPSFLETVQQLGQIHATHDSPAHEYTVHGVHRYDVITPTFNAKLSASIRSVSSRRRRPPSAPAASKQPTKNHSSHTGNPKAEIERLLRWRGPELLVFDLDSEVVGDGDSEAGTATSGSPNRFSVRKSARLGSPSRAVVATMPLEQALSAPGQRERRPGPWSRRPGSAAAVATRSPYRRRRRPRSSAATRRPRRGRGRQRSSSGRQVYARPSFSSDSGSAGTSTIGSPTALAFDGDLHLDALGGEGTTPHQSSTNGTPSSDSPEPMADTSPVGEASSGAAQQRGEQDKSDVGPPEPVQAESEGHDSDNEYSEDDFEEDNE